MLYAVFIYVCTKAFLLCLITAWENHQKKKERGGKLGKDKLNEKGALNMK